MKHFTSTCYVIHTKISGMHGTYGATTILVGFFNTFKRAEQARADYIKMKNNKYINLKNVEISEISPCVIDETILSKVYE